MLKTVAVAIIAALPLLFNTGEVRAQGRGLHGVQCPVGTCSPRGGPRAREVGFCKPSHCKRARPT
jgi:hypothetical protein